MEPLARFARKDGGCGRVNRRVMCAGRARVPVKAAAQKRRRLRTASMRGPGCNDLPRRDPQRRP